MSDYQETELEKLLGRRLRPEGDDSKPKLAGERADKPRGQADDALPKPSKRLTARASQPLHVSTSPLVRSSTHLDAGEIAPGQSRTFKVYVWNDDDVERRLAAFTIEGSTAFTVLEPHPKSLPPAGGASVVIKFQPNVVTEQNATLVIDADPCQRMTWPLVGGRRAVAQPAKTATKSTSSTVKREDHQAPKPQTPSEVELLDVSDQHNMTFDDLVNHRFRAIDAAMQNYMAALENFETVVEHASVSETVAASSAAIAIGQLTQHLTDHLVAYSLRQLPCGSELGELFMAGSINSAIQAEKARARGAKESNAISRYIVITREWISRELTKLSLEHDKFLADARADFLGRPEPEQRSLMNTLKFQNAALDQAVASGEGDVRARFLQIAAGWIDASRPPGAEHGGYIRVRYDKDWSLIGVHVEAPRGQRLAEEMTREGPVELPYLKCRRVVQWMPAVKLGERLQGIVGMTQLGARLEAEFSADGKLVELRANDNVRHRMDEFKQRLSTLVLPSASTMTGTDAS